MQVNATDFFDDTELGDEVFDGGLKNVRIGEIMRDLDPVVKHNEYYYGANGHRETRYLACNGDWVIYAERYDKPYFLINSETREKIQLDIENKYELIGINNKGIWFFGDMEFGDKFPDQVPTKIYQYDTEGNMHSYVINPEKYFISECYIRGDIFAVVAAEYADDLVVNSRVIEFRITASGVSKIEMFECKKGESVSRLVLAQNNIAYRVSSEEVSCWHISDYNGQGTVILNDNNELDLQIKMINIDKNTMWTSVTQREKQLWGLDAYDHCIVARVLEQPVEGRCRTYKTDNKPAIWKYKGWRYDYFDGSVMYESKHTYRLVRYDKNGNEYELSGGGHGEAGKFAVSPKYIYVNYDAIVPVKLPKAFDACDKLAENNPQSDFIFGKKNISF